MSYSPSQTAPFEAQTQWLFVAVLGVLIVASVIGGLLKWRVAHGEPHNVIDNLNSRIKAWWVMVLLVSLSFAFGKTGVILLFLFMSFAALREYVTLTYTRTADHLVLALMFYVA
ncbi:MAG: phosphatidate cytidylyltransferase, partial [Rhizobacter sp.]